MSIKAVIFDVGGVLTHGSFSESFASTLGSHYGLNPNRVREVFVANEGEYLKGMEEQREVFKRVAKILDIPFEPDVLSDLFTQSIHINHDTMEIVKQLHGRLDLLIASDNYDEMVAFLRPELELDRYFSTMVFSNEIHRRKVSKEFFAPILERYEPSECVFVDDKQVNIALGEEIGFQSLLFTDAGSLNERLTTIIGTS